MSRRIAALAVAIALAPRAYAQPAAGSGSERGIQIPHAALAPDVRAAASPTEVRLGARFTLFVTATFAAGVEVNLREPIDLGPALEVRRTLSEDRPSGDGRTTREWQLEVMPWELGELSIAPIAVTFTALGRAGQVQTNAVPLRIIGTLGDLAEAPELMRGLAAPTGLYALDWFWIWAGAAAGGVIGAASVALWIRARRRRRTRRLVGSSVALPPRIDMTQERALERLLAIEESGVLQRDADRKTGYAELVAVIRDYLGARYRIAVHDRTSSELLGELAQVAPADEVVLVSGWLGGCDRVKYGGHRATGREAGRALDDARALIVTTAPGAGAAKETA